MNESMLHAGAPNPIHLGYAHAVRCYNSSNSFTLFVSVIFCNLYGPHDNFNIYEGHVIGSLIQKSFMSSIDPSSEVSIMNVAKMIHGFFNLKKEI
ncbi:hypothetical protein MXB_2848, partial [Myxobolus squamalis]